ncbi:mannan endo-1,4-beta-mannosidase [Saccharobesus litoralis]|uniref:Mannan endo-1,4-beta-mannosidase n=1 Tax=Saccharobesus litoralis TaxID=2172099 RepID=A0A2S0VXJ8_9ALTE|nr:mannan endo-1,4-beta-mannosidase [Saccharobesus litoralis]
MPCKLKSAGSLLLAATISAVLAGCGPVEEKTLNTDTVEYTPEERPVAVVAGVEEDKTEVPPNTEVTLTSRLLGPVTDQTVVWTQTSGTPLDGLTGLDQQELTFTAPAVSGTETFTFQLSVLDGDGNPELDENGNPVLDEITITVFDESSKIVLEVETEGVSTGPTIVSDGDANFLPGGVGSHTSDFIPGTSVTFTVNVPSDTFVTLYGTFAIPASGYGDGKGAVITVNGLSTEVFIPATGSFAEYRYGVYKLNAGDNIIEVGGGWDYYRLDSIAMVTAEAPAGPVPVVDQLVNDNATQSAKDLMSFLVENYGSATLSGQTEFPRKDGDSFPLTEFNKITAATGDDAPAIVAFDYMNYSSSHSGNNFDGLTESIIAEHEAKNIVISALWHWRAPSGNTGSEGSFYSNGTNFDLAAALADTNSAEYAELIADIDIIAAELQKLEDADVPVLWRPLHEASGGWFWWGNHGADALKDLWVLMYDRMTTHHGLDNLIWVFTHTHGLPEDWYPGDDYVDIVGFDGYADPRNDSSATFSQEYATLKDRHDGQKLIALTETGTIPNVETMHGANAWWSFFITWNSEVWDSSSVIGPQGANSTDVDTFYAQDGVINLADIPGGRAKTEAGIFDNFEISSAGFEGQINWSPSPGLSVMSDWAASGAYSLTYSKDLSAEAGANGVIMQTYPAGGIDVSSVNTLSLNANAMNVGDSVTIKLWAKDGSGVWRDAGATALVAGGLDLAIDVSDIDNVSGFGLQIEGFDTAATDAKFYLDNVRLDDTLIHDFEPQTSGFEGQINWSTKPGITVTNGWATSGVQALTYVKDLSAEAGANGVIMQTYPEGGIDVTGVNMLKVSANAVNAGDATTIKLWAKDGAGVWRDAGATALVAGGLELAVDVSDIDNVSGFGLQIENFDATATDAMFYLDNVRLDDAVLFDFEGTGKWEFQNNWSPVSGIQLAQDWVADGANSLSGVVQLADGDDNVVLQTYPVDGLLLGDVTTLHITASAKDAGSSLQAMLFVKDQDGTWSDSGAVDVVDGGVELSIDVSGLSELSGFGVRFMSPDNSTTPAQFYIDKVEFK